MQKHFVPKPPRPSPIKQRDQEYLDGWEEYYKTLSPRIRIIKVTQKYLDSLKEQVLEEDKYIDIDMTLVDWPTADEVAFLIEWDSAYPGKYPILLLENTYLFCFGRKPRAFGVTYFEWDGDMEDDPRCSTYSLSQYPQDALSWKYITKRIREGIEEIENSVPEPKFP